MWDIVYVPHLGIEILYKRIEARKSEIRLILNKHTAKSLFLLYGNHCD